MTLFFVWLVLNIGLAVGAFWIATSRQQYARYLWWIAGAFLVAATGLVIDVATNASLSHSLLNL